MSASDKSPAGRQIILASNAAFITGVVLFLVGVFVSSLSFVAVVGVFLLAVAIGLTLFNRSQRNARLNNKQPPG